LEVLKQAVHLFSLQGYDCREIEGHEGGRNRIFVCTQDGQKKYVLRVSATADRTEKDYRAETAFVHYLAQNGAPVADVIPSIHGKFVEAVEAPAPADDGNTAGDGNATGNDHTASPVFISLFAYARGMLLCDNGYRYREGAALEEYFYTTGKTLGKIHALSKQFEPDPDCRRPSYFDKYNMEYIGRLIPDDSGLYADLKKAIADRLQRFHTLPTNRESFGLVHFDYSDGNYHIDMTNGDITVFDFDNCMYCWYIFDLANLWTHGEGWCRGEPDPAKREAFMRHYFDTILAGYTSETAISDALIQQLPLFIDMVMIENIVDEFECAAREGEAVDYEDIEAAADHLTKGR
jgi:Ser/Thr protein kinase RdoA (MazF antagonist)